MANIRHWALIAAVALVFGFIGSLGAIWLMEDQLRGPRGDAGPQGVVGPPGPPGGAADIAPALDVVRRDYTQKMDLLRAALDDLQKQVDTQARPCVPTTVLTDAWLTDAFGKLVVDTKKQLICARLG